MGAAAVCEVALAGAHVTLIDQSTLPNPRGSSFDHSKVFRFAYPEPLYVRMAVESLELWRALEDQTGERFLTSTGIVLLGSEGSSFETDCFNALRSSNLEAELLDSAQLTARFPQFNPAAIPFAVFDPSGAILHAERAVRALIKLAVGRGVRLFEQERVTRIELDSSDGLRVATESGSTHRFDKLLVASGAWTRSLIPELAVHLTATRQESCYLKYPVESGDARSASSAGEPAAYEPERFPIFIDLTSGFYGFPLDHGAVKISNHNKGEKVDPESIARLKVGEEFVSSCRGFFDRYIPGLGHWALSDARVCLYNNTRDDDFIIDWHPDHDGLLIATGFSGHGFKFGSLIGRIAAELLIKGRSSFDIGRFTLDRFAD
jgi:monomeric sarcosine oxidase